jgi:simple sugar transport system permease protein
VIQRFFGLAIGLSASLLLVLIAGENPFSIFQIIIHAAFGSVYDFGMTLSYVAPLIFTGLSVAIALQAGLFNIGAEGQMLIGTAACTGFAVFFPNIPFPWAPILALAVGICGGSFWGWFVGWAKSRLGSHEVIMTIMMNFIASGLVGWFVLHVIPSTDTQNPESALISSNYAMQSRDIIAQIFVDTPASSAIIIGIILAIAMWIFLRWTPLGFALRATGLNAEAAERSGINVKKIQVLAMVLAGFCASFVAYSEILGSTGRLRLGFSPDYGFLGIAVAILASNHPLGVVASAFLLGALHKGATDLDLETMTITRDFSKIIQGLIILASLAQYGWIQRLRTKNAVPKLGSKI